MGGAPRTRRRLGRVSARRSPALYRRNRSRPASPAVEHRRPAAQFGPVHLTDTGDRGGFGERPRSWEGGSVFDSEPLRVRLGVGPRAGHENPRDGAVAEPAVGFRKPQVGAGWHPDPETSNSSIGADFPGERSRVSTKSEPNRWWLRSRERAVAETPFARPIEEDGSVSKPVGVGRLVFASARSSTSSTMLPAWTARVAKRRSVSPVSASAARPEESNATSPMVNRSPSAPISAPFAGACSVASTVRPSFPVPSAASTQCCASPRLSGSSDG